MNKFLLEDASTNTIVDVSQKLIDNRIIFICDPINYMIATNIVANLMLKDQEDPESKITMLLNTDFGDIRSILMIYDVMKIISAPIETVCVGEAMGEPLVLLTSGTKGMRHITKNSRISVTQLYHNYMARSNLTMAKKYLDLAIKDNESMMKIIAENSGKTLKRVLKDFNEEVFMTAEQAVEYGLVDKIVGRKNEQI